MTYIKRAWLSVVRRKGKSLILLLVVFVLGNFIAGTFAIKQATDRVEANLKTKLGFNATVALDYDTIFEDFDYNSPGEPTIPKIPAELIEKIGNLREVSFYDYSRQTHITTSSMKSVSYDDSVEEEGPNFFNIHGVEYLDLLDAKIGRIELESGRTFKEEDLAGEELPIIISEEMMTKNNFRLDEVVEVKVQSDVSPIIGFREGGEGEEETTAPIVHNYKFKIVGTFKPITFGKGKDNNYSVVEMMNRIYVPNQVVVKMLENELKAAEENGEDIEGNSYLKEMLADNFNDSVFVTESPEALDSFVAQVTPMLEKGLKVQTSQQALDMVSFSISMMKDLSSVVLKSAVAITVIVLSLFVVLFLRDRKHEMGIYLAIGDHKWKVLSQVTLEVLMITLMGLTLSFGTGIVLANKASDALMMGNMGQEVMIDTSSSYIPAVNLSEIDEDYEVKITPSYILSTYAIGTAVAIASSVVPMLYVTRLKPKKILM